VIPFAIGALWGAGCMIVWSEMYTRWLYKDVKRRAKRQGITDQQMKDALIWATEKEIEANLNARPATKR